MFTKNNIEIYFDGFKNEQLFLFVLGGICLTLATVMYVLYKQQWYKGFALPLAVFALVCLGAGYTNYSKIATLKVRSLYNYDMHPEQLKIKELPRIIQIEEGYMLLIYINASILIASFIIFYKSHNTYYKGVAAALFLVACISVLTYYIFKSRTFSYKNGIQQFTKQIIVK